jgi:hypothetical protein
MSPFGSHDMGTEFFKKSGMVALLKACYIQSIKPADVVMHV